jgi:transcriptional regulator with PAS, ATPase and Fis domain
VIPPLRERKEDLPDLVYYFIEQLSPFFNKQIERVDDSCINLLMEHNWPGNVRELKNAVQFALAKSSGDTLYPEHFQDFLRYLENKGLEYLPGKQEGNLEEIENELIFRRLKLNHGNKTKTAKDLGIGRATLYRRLKAIEKSAALFQKE